MQTAGTVHVIDSYGPGFHHPRRAGRDWSLLDLFSAGDRGDVRMNHGVIILF
jgi:hypothetical protein